MLPKPEEYAFAAAPMLTTLKKNHFIHDLLRYLKRSCAMQAMNDNIAHFEVTKTEVQVG